MEGIPRWFGLWRTNFSSNRTCILVVVFLLWFPYSSVLFIDKIDVTR